MLGRMDNESSTGPLVVAVAIAEETHRDQITGRLQANGHTVMTATSVNGLAVTLEREQAVDLVIADADFTGGAAQVLEHLLDGKGFEPPLILASNRPTVTQAVQSMRAGAADYVALPVSSVELDRVVSVASVQARQLRSLRTSAGSMDPSLPLVFQSAGMTELLGLVREIADSKASVLIQGASGTGKELLARSLHMLSARHEGPFVVVDSSAIPETLLESELFGYRRGAFTGADRDKPGIIESADGGTLFLDEVGNLSPQVQAKLLRFLQERTLRRVGDVHERSVDIRLLSASNRDIRAAAADGSFREDLYYRLSVFTLDVPPLRDRSDDIPVLAAHFIHRHNVESGYRVDGIHPDAMEALVSYPWPGNVRQLENIVERAVILRRAGAIQLADLPDELVQDTIGPQGAQSLHEIEREHVLRLLDECGGNKSQVARILGISRRTVYRKLKAWLAG